MNSSLIPWVRKPFTTTSMANGSVGDRTYSASYLGLSDTASFNVVRVLGVTHNLNLVQSKYYVETASNALTLTQTPLFENVRLFTLSQSLGISHSVHVAGGQAYTPIHEIIADGTVLAGQAIYIKADGHAAVTEADDATKSSVAGLAFSDGGGSPSGTLSYLIAGLLTLEDWTDSTGSTLLTPGAVYYISAATDGNITITAPSASGTHVVKVGRALNTTTIGIELGEGVGL